MEKNKVMVMVVVNPKIVLVNPLMAKNGQNGVDCQSLDSIFDSMEKGDQLTLDSHLDDDVPEGARKSIVNDFIQDLKTEVLYQLTLKEC